MNELLTAAVCAAVTPAMAIEPGTETYQLLLANVKSKAKKAPKKIIFGLFNVDRNWCRCFSGAGSLASTGAALPIFTSGR